MQIEKYKKLLELTIEKRKVEDWAKRRGGEFFYTVDEKAKLRGINAKIDRLIESQPAEAIPQKMF